MPCQLSQAGSWAEQSADDGPDLLDVRSGQTGIESKAEKTETGTKARAETGTAAGRASADVILKAGKNLGGQVRERTLSLESQIVARSFHFEQFILGGDQRQRLLHFLDTPKRIARAMDKQARRAQVGQMLNAELVLFTRRMQRVGEKQERGDEIGLVGTEDGGLAASVGVSAEKDLAGDEFSHCGNRIAQASAIAFGLAGEGRPEWFCLAKRKIATQNSVAVSAKSLGDRDEKWSVRVASRAMGEDEGVIIWGWRSVEISADGGIESGVEKRGHESFQELVRI